MKSGGAWDGSVMARADAVRVEDSMNSSASPRISGEKAMLADVGWPTSTRADGMLLQQSCPA